MNSRLPRSLNPAVSAIAFLLSGGAPSPLESIQFCRA